MAQSIGFAFIYFVYISMTALHMALSAYCLLTIFFKFGVCSEK